jgi:hypothetical protein
MTAHPAARTRATTHQGKARTYMSWDVLLCKFSRKYTHVDQMAKDEKFLVLGVRDEIQAIISSIFPGTDWNDSSWGHYSGNYGSFEFNLGDNDPTTSLFLHIRGCGAHTISGILKLCEHLDCQAIDCNDSRILDQVSDPTSGLRQWQAYRDQIVGNVAE